MDNDLHLHQDCECTQAYVHTKEMFTIHESVLTTKGTTTKVYKQRKCTHSENVPVVDIRGVPRLVLSVLLFLRGLGSHPVLLHATLRRGDEAILFFCPLLAHDEECDMGVFVRV